MKRSKRIIVIISSIFILIGAVLIFVGASMIGFDFTQLNSVNLEKNSHFIYEDYENIDVSDLECDVIFKYRRNTKDVTLIEAMEGDGIENSIEVVDGTLKIRRVDNRKWYEKFSFWWADDSTLVVYLPDTEYDSIRISTASGNIEVPEKLEFSSSDIKTVSGDINFMALTHGQLNIKSTSGDIECIASGNEAKLKTVSGNIAATSLAALELSADSTSGDVNVLSFSGEILNLRTTSGDVKFTVYPDEYSNEKFNENFIEIKTTSGDVNGGVYCDFNYKIKTTSGDVYAPQSVGSAPDCIIKTTSGDVKIIKHW